MYTNLKYLKDQTDEKLSFDELKYTPREYFLFIII